MTKKICFVIQPFSEPYKNRYKSIYEPAIRDAGLIPYRTGGHSVDDIPKDIRYRIRNEHMCFADITEDKPNVWYEVGFAHACYKQVVMVCDEEKRPDECLPFDISARNVLFYKGKEVDFDGFYRNGFIKDITERTKARSKESDTAQQPQNSDNLTAFDGEVLKVIYRHYLVKRNSPMVRGNTMSKFPDAREDALVSIDKLELYGYIKEIPASQSAESIVGYHPTEKGRQWCLNNKSD